MRFVLFEPDIPQNAGSLIRLGACMGVPLDVIEPCGFVFSEAQMRRAGMDYVGLADVVRHVSWAAYIAQAKGRIVLATTRAAMPYAEYSFVPDDNIVLGRESAGVPDAVHDRADARLRIPMKSGLRSINVAQAGAMILGEALRQTRLFP
jgi:tRNA (cytidine/uridine-2'-O-)-methyltransferase